MTINFLAIVGILWFGALAADLLGCLLATVLVVPAIVADHLKRHWRKS